MRESKERRWDANESRGNEKDFKGFRQTFEELICGGIVCTNENGGYREAL